MREFEVNIEISEIDDKERRAWFERPEKGGLTGMFYKDIFDLEFNGYIVVPSELVTFSTPDWLQFKTIRASA